MKRVTLIPCIILFLLAPTINPVFADVCIIPEGTYVGAVKITSTGEVRPLFFVVSNNRISGFFAPEDQHTPGGAPIDQTDTKANSETQSGYNFSLGKGKIIFESPSGGVKGSAKRITVKNGSGSFQGYFKGSTGFLNIAPDGGAVVSTAAGRFFLFFFGTIDSQGNFLQKFPENGLKLSMKVSAGSASLTANVGEDLNTDTLTKEESGSSAGGIGEVIESELQVQEFKALLSDYQKILADLLKGTPSLVKFGIKAGRTIKAVNVLLEKSPRKCDRKVGQFLIVLATLTNQVEGEECLTSEFHKACISSITLTQLIPQLRSKVDSANKIFETDKDSDEISDICQAVIN